MAEKVSLFRERGYLNKYAQTYADLVSIPANFTSYNRIHTKTFNSHPSIVKKRQRTLEFSLGRAQSKRYTWSDTLLSERVTGGLLYGVFNSHRVGSRLALRLAPTELDESNKNMQSMDYQKGMDLVILDRRNDEALLGIDVTIGNYKTVHEKRKRPGIQLATATPVIILPMEGLWYDEDRGYSFLDYLRSPVYESIVREGQYKPFYGLDLMDRYRWTYTITHQLLDAITHTRKSLQPSQKTSGMPPEAVERALKKLDLVEGIISPHHLETVF